MIDVTDSMRSELKSFNVEHRVRLTRTARTLLDDGIRRVHFGVDYVNDDGDPADYAVLEYADGRVEERDAWLDALDYDVFYTGLRYCQPYTFDAESATLSFDDAGGTIDTEENVIRMYHSPERREKLESWAEESDGIEAFFLDHLDELTRIAAALEALDVSDVCFGLDWVGDTLTLSEWSFMARRMGGDVILPLHAEPPELEELKALLEADFPLGGAFIFDTVQCTLLHDPDGGLVHIDSRTDASIQRAYRTEEQRATLERG
jgi:hypothetical protein